jgi:flagellar hook-basal body complex protein FliE
MSDPLGLISGHGQARPVPPGASRPQPPGQDAGPDFKDVLMKNIEQVNRLQQDAEKAIEDLSSGKRDDVANVMIAKNKADMAFRMLLQVRNKMMDAYAEVKETRV